MANEPGLQWIENQPFVESIDDGRRTGDGLFVNLKPGFTFDFEASSAGFDNLSKAKAAVKKVYRIGGPRFI